MPVQAIKPKRLYQQISEQLLQMIESGEYGVGDSLPPEQELARQLGVSRPSVREALIVLETANVIEVRTGSGSYVRPAPIGGWRLPWTAPDDPGPGPIEQFRARCILEPVLAAEAARRATTGQLAELDAIVDRIETSIRENPQITAEHWLFHEKLAEASHNDVLADFAKQLIRLNQTALWQTLRERVDTFEGLSEGVAARREILVALGDRDATAAEDAMQRHLARVGRIFFGRALDDKMDENQPRRQK